MAEINLPIKGTPLLKRPSKAGRPPRGPVAASRSSHSARRKLDDRVHNHLRDAIANGRIRPGERIQPDALASQLGVARLYVVNALKRLAIEGVVDRLSRRGIYVRLLGRQEMTDLLLVRESLESLAARLAASRVTPAETARLGRVEYWPPAGRSGLSVPAPFVGGASRARPCATSSTPSSNRTCGSPASGSPSTFTAKQTPEPGTAPPEADRAPAARTETYRGRPGSPTSASGACAAGRCEPAD
jgi:DNA-binding transcriptional regulator YhcF (GntR family)